MVSKTQRIKYKISEKPLIKAPAAHFSPAKLAVLLLFLSFTPAISLADDWILMAPDFTINGTEITATNKWVALESFATAAQCNDRRSSLIKQIDKERRDMRDVANHNVAVETEQELRLLWHTYTKSKCVSSR